MFSIDVVSPASHDSRLCKIFFPSQGQGHVLMLILLQRTPMVSQTCLTFQFRQTLVSRKIFPNLSGLFHLWLLIFLHASTPALFNLFLTYMLVFPSLVFIIFKDFVCLYLLHFTWRSGGLIYEITRIMLSVIFRIWLARWIRLFLFFSKDTSVS